MNKKLLLISLFMPMFLTGCGSSGDNPTPTPEPTPGPEPEQVNKEVFEREVTNLASLEMGKANLTIDVIATRSMEFKNPMEFEGKSFNYSKSNSESTYAESTSRIFFRNDEFQITDFIFENHKAEYVYGSFVFEDGEGVMSIETVQVAHNYYDFELEVPFTYDGKVLKGTFELDGGKTAVVEYNLKTSETNVSRLEFAEMKIHLNYGEDPAYFELVSTEKKGDAYPSVEYRLNDKFKGYVKYEDGKCYDMLIEMGIIKGVLKYEDATYNESTHLYEYTNLDIMGQPVDFKIGLADEKICHYEMHYSVEEKAGTQTFDGSADFTKYGSTSITLPQPINVYSFGEYHISKYIATDDDFVEQEWKEEFDQYKEFIPEDTVLTVADGSTFSMTSKAISVEGTYSLNGVDLSITYKIGENNTYQLFGYVVNGTIYIQINYIDGCHIYAVLTLAK